MKKAKPSQLQFNSDLDTIHETYPEVYHSRLLLHISRYHDTAALAGYCNRIIGCFSDFSTYYMYLTPYTITVYFTSSS